MTKISTHFETLEKLPFNVEISDNHLILSTKPKKNLNRQKRKEFEKNKVKVSVELFDKNYVQRLTKIRQGLEDDFKFSTIIKNVRFRFIEFLFR